MVVLPMITILVMLTDNASGGSSDDNGYGNVSDTTHVNIHSASSLYSQSLVLSQDKRYMNINEVLMDCTLQHPTTKNNTKDRGNNRMIRMDDDYNNNNSNNNHINEDDDVIDWKILLYDIICICQNKRMVLRVLFDTIDILNKGYKCLKKLNKGHNSSKEVGRDDAIEIDIDIHAVKKNRKAWKLAMKKIEYYTSWTNMNWDDNFMAGEGIVNDARIWMDDWILKDDDRIKMNDITMIGNISSSCPTSTTTTATTSSFTMKDRTEKKIQQLKNGKVDLSASSSDILTSGISTTRNSVSGSKSESEPFLTAISTKRL